MDKRSTKRTRSVITWSIIVFVASLSIFLIQISNIDIDILLPLRKLFPNHIEISPILDYIDFVPLITAGISGITLIVTLISTTSTMLLGWRNERRQDRESRLKVQQLELQLEEARMKLNKTNVPQGNGNQP